MENRVLCKICEKEVHRKKLSSHIKIHNISQKEYYDEYLKSENEGKCKTCGNETRFKGLLYGYSSFCSNKCTNNNKEIRDKIKSTSLERYGKATNLQLDSAKIKREESTLKKFGVKHPFQSKEVQDKIKENLFEKFGVTNTGQLKSTQDKVKSTLKERYGVEHNFNIPNIRAKIVQQKQDEISSYEKEGYINLAKIFREFGTQWFYCKSFNVPLYKFGYYRFIKEEDYEKIKKFTSEHKKEKSAFERNIFDFVKSITNLEILRNKKTIIKPLELDIYIPDKKIAIECNGTWYHSINHGIPINYHLDKTRMCENKGIRLIHIFEWEWQNKHSICQSIISSALGVYKERIYARNCEVREVDSKTAKEFLELNHIQGNVYSSYRLGLFYKDELVQLITLGSSRFKKRETELLRMCSKLNTQVVGGFSKLFKYIPDDLKEVYSYIDKGKFDGKGYYSTGWEFVSETDPGYYYYYGDDRYSRNQCQKHKLKRFLGEENFDENATETENMLNNGFLKVYDCGNIKVKWNKEYKQ